MNNKEFIEEVRCSGIAPENFDHIYDTFQKYQDVVLEILKDFHQICETNGIHYQLAFGSLLGAIRDDGQIPWDYDVDVFVPYQEKNALVEALKKQLKPEYYFYCPDVDPKCRHNMMRITPVGFHSDAIHVDVFYLTGISEDHEQAQKDKDKIHKLYRYRYLKLVNIKEATKGNPKKMLSLIQERRKCRSVNLNEADREYDRLCLEYDIHQSSRAVIAKGAKREYEHDIIMNTMLYNTKKGVFRIPVHYKQILQMTYGDWEKYLPVSRRITEVLNSSRNMEFYQLLSKRRFHSYFDVLFCYCKALRAVPRLQAKE